MECDVESCEKMARVRGLCQNHYMRLRRTGRSVGKSTEERFWEKVDQSAECWNWTASKSSNGYGRFVAYADGARHLYMAHRFAYATLVGPIAEGFQLDHTCHNRACVNPSHLRQVTAKQNKENRLGPQANSSSGVRGVLWNARLGKWQGQVRHNKKAHYVGLFSDLAEAESAVTKKRVELFTHNDVDRKN